MNKTRSTPSPILQPLTGRSVDRFRLSARHQDAADNSSTYSYGKVARVLSPSQGSNAAVPEDGMAAGGELPAEGNANEYSRAFLVGWRLAQLHASPVHPEEISVVSTKDGYLPEIPGDFTPPQQATLIWTGLKGDLEQLPGGRSQEILDAITSLDQALDNKGYKKDALATAISIVYEKTLKNVFVVHPQLAKAIVLGRQLTDLVVGPANGHVAFHEQLNADLVKNTCLLLKDLQSCFRQRATAAVAGSLVYWQHWVAGTPAGDPDSVRDQLRRQGELWRSLLTGEIDPDGLLDLRDYRQAFMDYVAQVGWLCRKNPWLWLTATAVILGGAGGIASIVEWAPKARPSSRPSSPPRRVPSASPGRP